MNLLSLPRARIARWEVARSLRDLPLTAIWAILAYGGAILFMTPFVWMLSSSLKTQAQVFVFPPEWLPNPIQIENYWRAWTIQPTHLFFWNTIKVTLLATLGDLISSSLVAFGFARLRFRGRDVLFIVLLATLMLPAHVTLIPHFIFFWVLGWVNTHLPLIVPHWFGSALYIFLLRQFLMTISVELDDAAKIDGAGFFDLYRYIAMPLAKPALGVVAMYSITSHWTEFTQPLIYLSSKHLFTLAVGLRAFQTEQGFDLVHIMMAMATLAVLPVIVLFFVGQRFFVQGIVLQGMR